MPSLVFYQHLETAKTSVKTIIIGSYKRIWLDKCTRMHNAFFGNLAVDDAVQYKGKVMQQI